MCLPSSLVCRMVFIGTPQSALHGLFLEHIVAAQVTKIIVRTCKNGNRDHLTHIVTAIDTEVFDPQ
jgi:hypothetical protein